MEGDEPYCEPCYEKSVAPICEECKHTITGVTAPVCVCVCVRMLYLHTCSVHMHVCAERRAYSEELWLQEA